MQFRAWQLTTLLVAHAPLRISYALASLAGFLAYYVSPAWRRAVVRNFGRVGPVAGATLTGRRSLQAYCRYLVDFARLPSLSEADVRRLCDAGNTYERIVEAARGRGAVIACMHFGNWDLGAAAAAVRGIPLTVVVETFPDPRLDALVVGSRERLGMRVLRMESPGPGLVKTLRRGGLLALLTDRPTPGAGVPVTFFGETCKVPAGAARLAIRTGAAVIPAACARLSPNRPESVLLADFGVDVLSTGDEQADVARLTARIMQSHEAFIRAFPEQWYMFREMWPSAPAGVTA